MKHYVSEWIQNITPEALGMLLGDGGITGNARTLQDNVAS